ncbi:putative N-formylglutamate amidohydrolase [Desulfuromonas soudanensis]|uniref:Putative N-formylglutamate amidohydrolase n=1 Tax=Desulfuromonas soudanensis TaxID=1603606 RepID=A0A0M3QEW1_9BACT|nr:N-formylglutamate amidohydrolase [Desulfuromonas soudanensis]ALC15003.1 putative N-formylglutamate amidohydrolase [Desulfuromonas soudanensis]
MFDFCFVSCEHGGNRVPRIYRSLFSGAGDLLRSHRGYDIGALAFARRLATSLGVPLHVNGVTRLLVDANRSPSSRTLFSEFSRNLPASRRESILANYYHPYRRVVEAEVSAAIASGARVIHLSVHTFTPVFAGSVRRADIGLLYDPRRRAELLLCRKWQKHLQREDPGLRVQCNNPYRGTSDSVVTALRRRHDEMSYLGIEIEINQKFPQGNATGWRRLQALLVATCPMAVSGF